MKSIDISYTPVKAEISGDEDGLMKPTRKAKWATQPDCYDSLIYTVWDSADDYNKVAAHVGAPRTNCCTIYASRICHYCGGVCILNGMAVDLKQKYEARHNLEPQDIPCWARCCAEITWRQIVRDYKIRVGGGPMEPAVNRMSRG